MEKTLVNFKATRAERDRWHAALKDEGKNRSLTDVCRDALDRIARRVEKEKRKNIGGDA